MKQIIYFSILSLVFLSACNQPFKKAKDGSQYKMFSNANGKKIKTGDFIEMNFIQKYGDSLLGSSYEDGMPQFAPYDTAQFPPLYKEIFANLHIGDSVIVKISTDSLISKGQAAPFFKKGKFVYLFYKVANSYASQTEADSIQKKYIPIAQERAYQKQIKIVEKDLVKNKVQIEKDSKLIDDYLAKNNIKATKTKWGTYVAIQTEGIGDLINKNNVAKVNYTGRTLDSNKVFDSNTDPKFSHLEPIPVNMSQMGGMILGWTDALTLMKKGTKAVIYIPSSLAYGEQGREPQIKKNEILVFDMNVVDVISQEQAMAEQQAQQMKMQAQQQAMQQAQAKKGSAPQAQPQQQAPASK